MTDSYPEPVSDPAAEGLPEYADDDSSAWDDAQRPREADGPAPAPLPHDRDTGPMGIEEFGTTAEEQRLGSSLDVRLSREEPDVSPDSVPVDTDSRLADEATSQTAVSQLPEDNAALAEEPVDPHLDSVVSMYDRDDAGTVGRLVSSDDGSHDDTEKDEIGFDAGASGGGASAEELAVHPVPPREVGQ
jgi:hypothetical protein